MPGHHTARQKRMAQHIIDSAEKRGYRGERAKEIGWATINKYKKALGPRDGEGMSKSTKARILRNCFEKACSCKTAKATYAEYSMPTPPPPTPNPMIQPTTSKSSKKKTLRKDDGADANGSVYTGMGKSSNNTLQVISLDDAYALHKAEGAPGAPSPAPAPVQGPAKKFPRKMKPTVKMKPVSDQEAMANLKAGKFYEKALQAGYGNVSGGGALKAPNRGQPRASRAERGRPLDLMLAMDAQPAPAKAGPPKVYLPGVHNPNSPMRPGKKLKKTYPTINASMRPSVVSKKSPKPLDAGGATILSLSLSEPSTTKSSGVVNKSAGEAAMSKTNFNDIFKSESGAVADDVLCDCPHCEAPITKSDLTKAHEGKGKTTHLSGKKEGKSGAHVVEQNPTGGVMRGGDGHGSIPSSRGVPGAKKHDENHVQTTAKHKKPIVKAEASSDDESSDDASSDDASSEKKPFPPKMKKSITVRGTDYVQYVDDGSDAALAKSIAEGTLGGMGPANSQPTQPLDLNNDLTRLLY